MRRIVLAIGGVALLAVSGWQLTSMLWPSPPAPPQVQVVQVDPRCARPAARPDAIKAGADCSSVPYRKPTAAEVRAHRKAEAAKRAAVKNPATRAKVEQVAKQVHEGKVDCSAVRWAVRTYPAEELERLAKVHKVTPAQRRAARACLAS